MTVDPSLMGVEIVPAPESLPEPPPVLILTMTTDLWGRSNLRHSCDIEQAVEILRGMVDSLDEKIAALAAEADKAEVGTE